MKRTHGESGGTGRITREYRIWTGMLTRCRNPKAKAYQNYGGRGITIESRWLNYAQFLIDMGRAPSSAHSLERRDNDGPYSAENCVWAGAREQQRNRRDRLKYVIDGSARLLSEWHEHGGVDVQTAWDRIHRKGWAVQEAIFAPIRQGRPTHCHNGHPFAETGRREKNSMRCTRCKQEYDKAYRLARAAVGLT